MKNHTIWVLHGKEKRRTFAPNLIIQAYFMTVRPKYFRIT